MTRYTKALRQQIIRDFAVRHNGQYNPAIFLEDVRRTGEGHPAWDWFEWSDEEAAQQHRLWQAREFASGLRVAFEIEEIGRRSVKVVSAEMPLLISPRDGRNNGGGYYLADHDNPSHRREHCAQAAKALESWLERYHSALVFSGISDSSLQASIKALRNSATETAKAA